MAFGVSLYLGHSCTLFVYTRRTQSWHTPSPPPPQLSGFRCLLVSRAQLYIFCLNKSKIKLAEPLPPPPQVTLWGQRFKLYYQLVPVSPSPLPSRSFLVSKEDKNAPYLKCSEFFVPRSNDEIHGMCDSEGMGPVVVWNISIVLLHGKHKPPQFVNSKSIT